VALVGDRSGDRGRGCGLDSIASLASEGTVLVPADPSRGSGLGPAMVLRSSSHHPFVDRHRTGLAPGYHGDRRSISMGDDLWVRVKRRRVFHAPGDSVVGMGVCGAGDYKRYDLGCERSIPSQSESADGGYVWGSSSAVWRVLGLNRSAESHVKSKWFQELDRVIHEKGRLSILTLLASEGELSFTELRDLLGMTDGNLSLHLQTLQKAGYVAITRRYRNRRPWTTCSLTPEGRKAFERYLQVLERIIQTGRRGLQTDE